MNWKTTVALLAVVIGLALFIKFYESKQLGTIDAEKHAQNVVNFERDKIDGISIQNGDDKIDLRKHDQKWRLETPVKDLADNTVVDNLLSDLENWQKQATITAKEMDSDKAKLAEFGLNKSKLRMKLTGQGAPPEIWFGKDAALEGKMYVRFENSKETYLVPQAIRKEIEKKADDFRDKKLMDLTAAQVSRVLLRTAAGEMELQKQGDHWEIVKPMRVRADDQKVGDLIAQITTSRIEQFVAEDKGDLHPYGLAEPRGSVTLFGPDDKQGQMLQIGTSPEKNNEQVYVRFTPRSFVYTLPKKAEAILEAKPDDLRDRHLVRFDKNILDRVTIEPQGKPKIVLGRKNDNWTIVSRNNTPANASDANRLMDTLGNEFVTKFVEDVASNLNKYGLDKPQLQITLSSFASENTAETKAGDRPFAVIAFGGADGDNVYARVGDEPFVVAVRKSLLDNIFTDPVQWQALALFNFKPEQVHRLSVVSEHEVSVVRGPNNLWTAEKNSGPLNQSNVQSIVGAICALNAAYWVTGSPPANAFNKPQLVVTFTTSPGDKAIHKLTVGSTDTKGMALAKLDEREGVFALSIPEFNALRLPLVQPQATATPSASPTGSPVATPK
jgi:hypothetical protein